MNHLTASMHAMGLVSYLARPATLYSVPAYLGSGGTLLMLPRRK